MLRRYIDSLPYRAKASGGEFAVNAEILCDHLRAYMEVASRTKDEADDSNLRPHVAALLNNMSIPTLDNTLIPTLSYTIMLDDIVGGPRHHGEPSGYCLGRGERQRGHGRDRGRKGEMLVHHLEEAIGSKPKVAEEEDEQEYKTKG